MSSRISRIVQIAVLQIGIAVRAKWLATRIESALRKAGIDSVGLSNASDDGDAVRAWTMLRMEQFGFSTGQSQPRVRRESNPVPAR